MQTLTQIYSDRVADGTLRPDPAQEAVLPLFDRLQSDLSQASETKRGVLGFLGGRKKPQAAKGLYIWGGVGRGKSMLMDLFHENSPVPSRRVHFHAFMQEVQAQIFAAREKGLSDTLLPVIETVAQDLRLLCFDEMQITDIADAMIVGRLFEGLFERGVTVVTTSNRVPDDLYKNGLNRQLFLPFIEIIKDKLEVHHLHSPVDYRQGRLTGTPVYFSPINDDTRATIDGIWADLTGNATDTLTLKVKGRDVTLPKFHNGIARATFWDLCGQMFGPADYLAIADAVKLLIIEDIPRLGRGNFNEVKRFVTLIDALYEAKVRVVASAVDEPESLYVEGAGVFEFERTASRLREMQDKDWAQD
ncbi:cell division protein ZapE [Pacificibacter maritimus]|uniref:Cell division protein ZapE n=1 Tax=Pacificibacter maritimus TaxID=762213 RepID=A0A3N4U4B2_9RHOB|nr:cell division protein ZapE [Pacificibacter maritimus]RPE63145.1 cell division protein ZapE [Pacificibacter maritimus]